MLFYSLLHLTVNKLLSTEHVLPPFATPGGWLPSEVAETLESNDGVVDDDEYIEKDCEDDYGLWIMVCMI